MKLWLRGSVLAAAGLVASAALAADHRDGPAAKAAGESDINDVYTWMTDDNEKLVLIQTVGGLPGVDNFSSAVQYAFHVGRGDAAPPANLVAPPPDNTDIICEFDSNTAVACYVGQTQGMPADDFAIGDPSADQGITSNGGTFRVHAGPHADPFYFHLAGFNAARDLVNAAVAGGILTPNDFLPSGCVEEPFMNLALSNVPPLAAKYGGTTTVSGLLLGFLNGDINPDGNCADVAACTGAANTPGEYSVDAFETNKVLAIVIEIDKTAIAGTGEFFYVHASTHQKP